MLNRIQNTIIRVKRAIAYFKHGWNSRDYDWAFLFNDIVFKLLRMSEHFEEHGMGEQSTAKAKEMRECAKCLNTLIHFDENKMVHYLKLRRKFGIKQVKTATKVAGRQFFLTELKSINGSSVKEYNKELLSLQKQEERAKVALITRACELLRDRSELWWD